MQAEPTGPWWERSPGVPWNDLVGAHADAEGVLAVGRQFHYSNLAYALLGQVVARLRGTDWGTALQRHVLSLLELSRTTYTAEPPSATGFSVHPFTGLLTDEPAQDTGAMAPAGQLWSTVEDLCKWLAFLLHPDGQVLSTGTVGEMRTPQSGSLDDVPDYGLGLQIVRTDDRSLIGHGGSMPGFLAGLLGDPDSRVGAVMLANATSALDLGRLPRTMIETVLSNEPAVAPEWVPPQRVDALLAELAGLWHWGNTAYVMTVEGQHLHMGMLGAERGPAFRVEGQDRLVGLSGYHTGEAMLVVRRPDGTISHLDCATFILTRTPYDPAAPIPGGPPERM